jgi:hypothetical protein
VTPNAPLQQLGQPSPPPPPPPPPPPLPAPHRRTINSTTRLQPVPRRTETAIERRIRIARQNSSSDPGDLLRAIRAHRFASRAPTPEPVRSGTPDDE